MSLQVLLTVDQLKKEFNITSQDEPVFSLLERYQRCYQLVNQLLQESIQDTNHHITNKHLTNAKASDDHGSDTDFDSVTQLEDETGNARDEVCFIVCLCVSKIGHFALQEFIHLFFVIYKLWGMAIITFSLDLDKVSSTLSSTESEKQENKNAKIRKVSRGLAVELDKVKKELQDAQQKIKEMEVKERDMRDRLDFDNYKCKM